METASLNEAELDEYARKKGLVLLKKQMHSRGSRGRKISASDRSEAIKLIVEAVEHGVRLLAACERIDITKRAINVCRHLIKNVLPMKTGDLL